MSHELEKRDVQAGVDQAWHNMTRVVPVVTREIAHPFEVVACECPSIFVTDPVANPDGEVIGEGAYRRLIADDDKLPVGPPYNPETYSPSSIALFWSIIEKALADHTYEVVSAGSIRNRAQIFASIKLRDKFQIGDREFVDFLTILDSFDGSCALQAKYSSVCVVCANTFSAALNAGKKLGRAVHTKGFEEASARIVDSIGVFFSRAEEIQKLLTTSHGIQVDLSDARCWICGVDSWKKPKLTMNDVQRTARMTELFQHGKGNEGQTRLDAFSAITEFHTHESGKFRGSGNGQWALSEFGNSADVKERGLVGLDNWEKMVEIGKKLLTAAGAMIG